ncbi:MAG: heme exporter protein CcmD [Geminicoccaceae bacterium]
MSEYLAMGGYAAYVWSAFGIALVLMVGLFVQSRWSVRRRELELEQLRTQVRPQRARTVRPMRPTREGSNPRPGVSEGS